MATSVIGATKDFQNIYALYTACKTNGDQYKPLWDKISRVTGIGVNPDYQWQNNAGNKAKLLDEFVDDPTSSLCVNQSGDYMMGIMWGTGDNAFALVPSRHVQDLVQEGQVDDFYSYATDQTLYHMNHSDAGLTTALRPYAYDQFSFGTSGIGAFKNPAFEAKIDDNAIVFSQYGIDNLRIDEGKSGLVEICFTNFFWKVNRIVGEFCKTKGEIDDALVNKMPKAIKDAYNKQDFNQQFNLVFGFFPRENYDPKLKGKRGTRYRGVWFMESGLDNSIFKEEDYADRPIAVARMIKVRGEVYGRSSGTMLLSTIMSVNYMVGKVIEIVEKMAEPSLGMWNNSLFGDSVLDTSPQSLTIFNTKSATQGQKPVFPLYDVGDPSNIIKFLIPYLEEKITTAFKVDLLLDFATAKEMTATESLQRYAIRGKSLAGVLQQQKSELLEPLVKRCVSILWGLGELGVDPTANPTYAKQVRNTKHSNRLVPDAVRQCIAEGRRWYDIKFNNELEKLTRTEAVQNLVQLIQAITAIATLYPNVTQAVNWYQLLKEINDNLDFNNQLIISEEDFNAKIAAIAEQARAATLIQAGQAGAAINKDNSAATLNTQKAANVTAGQTA